MMYSKIINPKTGQKVSITGKLGHYILKQYLKQLENGETMVGGGKKNKGHKNRLKKINRAEHGIVTN